MNEGNSIYQEDQGYIILEIEYLESTYKFISEEITRLMNNIKEWDNSVVTIQ